jgi:hypothetical protein
MKRTPTDAERLASIREALTAAHGDWHELTNLWSIQADLSWLLANAERAPSTPPTEPAGLDVERVKRAIANIAARHGLTRDPAVPLALARIYGYSTATAEMDAEIAAEYARLSEAAE